MAGGYAHKPTDIAAINRRLSNMQRQIDSIRSAGRIRSAVIQGNSLLFIDESGVEYASLGQKDDLGALGSTGFLLSTPGPGEYLINAFYDLNTGDSYVIFGNSGVGTLDLDQCDIRADLINLGTPGFLPSTKILLSTIELGLYDIPTTSSAANLFLGTVGGKWTVARVTSSRRYKTDIADAQVDPADVLSLPSRTWVDLGDAAAAGNMVPKDPAAAKVDADGEPVDQELIPFVPPRQIGFIAEEAWERPTLRQFVGTDADDQPNSFDYDRFAAVGLHAALKHQQQRIDEQATEIESLKADVAAMKQAMEAK